MRWVWSTIAMLAFFYAGMQFHAILCDRPAAPAPAPVVDTMPGDRYWGLERWTIEGDSVILLKFRKLPPTGSKEEK